MSLQAVPFACRTQRVAPPRRRWRAALVALAIGVSVSVALPVAAAAPVVVYRDAWSAQAARVEITRDGWGIAHVHGRSDADAVFGMVYAQAEDDFNRIETNFLTNLGRLAEVEGEARLWQDLRQRLFIVRTRCAPTTRPVPRG
jgi:acyl-homoserine-lactone acylase